MLLPSNHLWDGNTTPCGVWEIISSHPHITPPLFFQHPPLSVQSFTSSLVAWVRLMAPVTWRRHSWIFHSNVAANESWKHCAGGADPLWACCECCMSWWAPIRNYVSNNCGCWYPCLKEPRSKSCEIDIFFSTSLAAALRHKDISYTNNPATRV